MIRNTECCQEEKYIGHGFCKSKELVWKMTCVWMSQKNGQAEMNWSRGCAKDCGIWVCDSGMQISILLLTMNHATLRVCKKYISNTVSVMLNWHQHHISVAAHQKLTGRAASVEHVRCRAGIRKEQ